MGFTNVANIFMWAQKEGHHFFFVNMASRCLNLSVLAQKCAQTLLASGGIRCVIKEMQIRNIYTMIALMEDVHSRRL